MEGAGWSQRVFSFRPRRAQVAVETTQQGVTASGGGAGLALAVNP